MSEQLEEQGTPSGSTATEPTPTTPVVSNLPATPTLPTTSKTQDPSHFERKLALIREFLGQMGTQKTFCRLHGINPATFSGWLQEYKREGEEKMKARHDQLQERSGHTGPYTPEERRKAVETYLKSNSPMDDFARLWGLGESSLRHWVQRYEEGGPKALEHGVTPPGRPKHRAVRELVERVKRENPAFGFRKIRDNLARVFGLRVSTGSVRNALKDKGYPLGGTRRRREKRQPPRRFERALPGELWQSDITSFLLPRHGVRVYLTVFLDDYSRYIVSWGLYLHQKQEIVIETLMQGIERFGKPKEVLTDQGRQYFTWRGKGDFQRLLIREGIQHVVARSHHPQTVGKTERFWATVQEEFWERVHPQDLTEAKQRLGHFIAHYNHFRPHQGIDGMVPADRFFGVETQVRKAMEDAMSRNELHLALGEEPRQPVFLVGRIGDQQVSMHGERGKLVVQTGDGKVQELGFEGLGMGPGEVGDGGSKRQIDEKRPGEEEVQVPGEASDPGEGGVGGGQRPGEGKSAPDGGGDIGVLDGKVEPGSGGPETSNAEAPGVAVVEASPIGTGGGAGEAAQSPGQEEDAGSLATGGGPQGPAKEDRVLGEGFGNDEGSGGPPEGASGEP